MSSAAADPASLASGLGKSEVAFRKKARAGPGGTGFHNQLRQHRCPVHREPTLDEAFMKIPGLESTAEPACLEGQVTCPVLGISRDSTGPAPG